MARKKTEMNLEKWNKTLLEDAPVRPRTTGPVSISAKSASWAATVEKPAEPATPVQHEVLLVSEKDAARILGVSRRTVFALNKQGILAARKVGKRKLYSFSSLKLFAEGQVA